MYPGGQNSILKPRGRNELSQCASGNLGFPIPNFRFPPPNLRFPPPNLRFPPPNLGFPPPNLRFSPPNLRFPPPNLRFSNQKPFGAELPAEGSGFTTEKAVAALSRSSRGRSPQNAPLSLKARFA
jgi:hypothetical protein